MIFMKITLMVLFSLNPSFTFSQKFHFEEGIVIESLEDDCALLKAGVCVGDTFTKWERLSREKVWGKIDNPFDWWNLAFVEASLGPICLFGIRNNTSIEIEIEDDYWRAQIRPKMLPQSREKIQAIINSIDHGQQGVGMENIDLFWKEIDLNWIWLELARKSKYKNSEIWDKAVAYFKKNVEISFFVKDNLLIFLKVFSEEMINILGGEEELFKIMEDQEKLNQLAISVETVKIFMGKESFLNFVEEVIENEDELEEVFAESVLLSNYYNAVGLKMSDEAKNNETERYYLGALKIAQKKCQNSLWHSMILNNIGTFYIDKQEYVVARKYIEKSLSMKIKNKTLGLPLAKSYQNLGNIEMYLMKYDSAHYYYDEALNHLFSTEWNEDTFLSVWQGKGLCFLEAGEYDLALEAFYCSLAELPKKNVKIENIRSFLHAFGETSYRLGDIDLAERLLKLAYYIDGDLWERNVEVVMSQDFDVLKGLPDVYNINLNDLIIKNDTNYFRNKEKIQILKALGLIYRRQGDFEKAEKFFLDTLMLVDYFNIQEEIRASIQNFLAGVYLKKFDYENANYFYQMALDNNPIKNYRQMAHILNDMSFSMEIQGLLMKAKEYLKKSIEISLDNNRSKKQLKFEYCNLSNIFLKENNLSEALNCLANIVSLDKEVIVDRSNLLIYLNLANIYYESDLYEKSENILKKCRNVIDEIPYPSSLNVSAHYLAGKIALKNNNLKEARCYFDEAVSEILILGDDIENYYDGKIELNKFNNNILRDSVILDIKLNNLNNAVSSYEKYRAQVLKEQMSSRKIRLKEIEIPLTLSQKKKRYSFQYQKFLEKINTGSELDEKFYAEFQEIKFKYQNTKNQIQTIVSESIPRFSQKALNGFEIKNLMDNGTLMIAYLIGENSQYIFVIGKQFPIRVVEIPLSEIELGKIVSRWTGFLNNSRLGPISIQLYEAESKKLAELLIEPIREEIEKAERLVVVPDGPLWFVPFGALPFGSKTQKNKGFLIEAIPITTILSASLFIDLKSLPVRPQSKIFAFGDAIYPGEIGFFRNVNGSNSFATTEMAPTAKERRKDHKLAGPDFRAQSAIRRADPSSMKRIPHTAREVNKIAEIYGSSVQVLLRDEANEANLKALDRDIDILHIAAHGIVDNVRPMDSALVLTVNEDFKEGEENGILFAWEIFEDLRIDADLVVLSACESGLGKTSGGEGLIGLTRAFQFAGARSILASYWNITDGTTATFMEYFYTNLKAGMNKAEALRQAQISFIREPVEVPRTGFWSFLPPHKVDASHPYYWAAFQLIGPWD